jgi:hypothetical protein
MSSAHAPRVYILHVWSFPCRHSHVLPRLRAASFGDSRHSGKYGLRPFGKNNLDKGQCFKHAINPTHGSTERQLDVVIQGVYHVSQAALTRMDGLNLCRWSVFAQDPNKEDGMRSECQKARASATTETAEASLAIPLPCILPRRRLCNNRASVPRGCKQICTVTGFN